jgi:hypothetical protein
LFEHDLFGNPLSTFPDHAVGFIGLAQEELVIQSDDSKISEERREACATPLPSAAARHSPLASRARRRRKPRQTTRSTACARIK